MLVHGRDRDRAEQTLAELRERTGDDRHRLYLADFASLADVREMGGALERGYDGMRAYCPSKLAQVMHTFDLAERLEGSGVTANCLHPATFMPTTARCRLREVSERLTGSFAHDS